MKDSFYSKKIDKAKHFREETQQKSDFYYKLSELVDRVHVFQEKFLSKKPKYLMQIKENEVMVRMP